MYAKDTAIYEANKAINGVLDIKPYSELNKRSWSFRSVGYGSDYKKWKDIISTLQMIGYDYVVSIEHEDPLASVEEGFQNKVDIIDKKTKWAVQDSNL